MFIVMPRKGNRLKQLRDANKKRQDDAKAAREAEKAIQEVKHRDPACSREMWGWGDPRPLSPLKRPSRGLNALVVCWGGLRLAKKDSIRARSHGCSRGFNIDTRGKG